MFFSIYINFTLMAEPEMRLKVYPYRASPSLPLPHHQQKTAP